MVLLPDVPAADADPHALGQRQVALRDLAHEPALDASRGRGAARRRDRRSRSRSPRASATSSTACGSPRRSGRASSRARTTSDAGGCARTRAASAGRRARRSHAARAPGSGACGRSTAPRPFESDDPDSRAHLVGGGRRPPEPDVPGPARPGQRPALLAPEGDRDRGPVPTIATATSSSTRTARSRSIASGWRWRARRRARATCGVRCGCRGRSSPTRPPTGWTAPEKRPEVVAGRLRAHSVFSESSRSARREGDGRHD